MNIKIRNNFYILLPILTWLCITLVFTSNSNIYADDAGLIDGFQSGDANSYLKGFSTWVPGRNLTILFQYLLFKISFINSYNLVIYHIIAQLFYVSIAALIGRIIFRVSQNRLTASLIVVGILIFPTNLQILSWGLALPQHILSTLFSVLTVKYLLFPSENREIKIWMALMAMIFTYDQSAALAFFLIVFIVFGLNAKLRIFDIQISRESKISWVCLIFVYFLISFFGRRSLGVASTLSKDSISLLLLNLTHPFFKIAAIVHDALGIFFVLALILAILLIFKIWSRIRKNQEALMKLLQEKLIRLAIFLFIGAFVSYVPAALWYPDKRHYFLPATLTLLGIGMAIGQTRISNRRNGIFVTRALITVILLSLIINQNIQLQNWKDRDQQRQLFYFELAQKVNNYPKNSIFLINDVNPRILNLFYAENMPSAYKYYNHAWNQDVPKISQLSRIGSLRNCLNPKEANTEFIEIRQTRKIDSSYTFTKRSISGACL